MKAVLQRVVHARVEIDGRVAGAIEGGLLVLLCAERSDVDTPVPDSDDAVAAGPADESRLARGKALGDRLLAKLLKLRIFGDQDGKMNLSLQDVGGGLLIVSQFTLAADARAGNRPSFTQAAAPADGRSLYEHFVSRARLLHPVVATGEFGADMKVHLVNDGPVTIPLQMS